MIDLTEKPLRIRSVSEELEVKLRPVADGTRLTASSRGKGEWKLYGDGSRQCKVSVTNLDLPDGTELQLQVTDRLIGEMIAERGIARFRRESERGESVPSVQANDVLQVLLQGKVILEGSFYHE